jgi:hypothetical protein
LHVGHREREPVPKNHSILALHAIEQIASRQSQYPEASASTIKIEV